MRIWGKKNDYALLVFLETRTTEKKNYRFGLPFARGPGAERGKSVRNYIGSLFRVRVRNYSRRRSTALRPRNDFILFNS